jgi:methylenetetrahydrofolate--tRNA-(uracil-5-)-methyltransferase
MMEVNVIGAGLAGSEASLVLSAAGIKVNLFEMRPAVTTPAHKSDHFAELVCSNSLGSMDLSDGKGLLKGELEIFGSNLLKIAGRVSVRAGKALAVDRWAFQTAVTEFIYRRRNIEIVREEVSALDREGVTIVATGPLTSDTMCESIRKLLGEDNLYFYDAISPIVSEESLDLEKGFFGTRYAEGDDYLNFPLTEEQFAIFYRQLIEADEVAAHEFEDEAHFESCMPIEVIARRGKQTLLFGPMRPVGLIDPKTGKRPFCVVQLRRENEQGTMYNLVGFQTRLKIYDQKRVFSLIPGFERCEWLRFGSVHRNTYINSPAFLLPTLELESERRLMFAGQICGVEGYVESITAGFVAGLNAAMKLMGNEALPFPQGTMIGGLLQYISDRGKKEFQPINANFGLLPLPDVSHKKRDRRAIQVKRALEKAREFKDLHFKFQPLCVI